MKYFSQGIHIEELLIYTGEKAHNTVRGKPDQVTAILQLPTDRKAGGFRIVIDL